MPSQKLANLNLNQSLEDFQFLISELLELSNLNQWSGTIIKDREEI